MKTVNIKNNQTGYVSTLQLPAIHAEALVKRMNSDAAKAQRERMKLGDLSYSIAE